MVIKEYLQDIQHASHLGEDQDTMGIHLQLVEKGVQCL